ncbi:MAG TPA: hypothetical protein VN851_05290 [Thermoanaerobaculia bacterium]|nr:hypothetical protein [Thermoanaerobaculia bacterium]
MEPDEIMQEVRAIREAYAERFNFDIRALYLDAKAREGQDGRRVVMLEPRPLEPEEPVRSRRSA